jgi:hypothetical protein
MGFSRVWSLRTSWNLTKSYAIDPLPVKAPASPQSPVHPIGVMRQSGDQRNKKMILVAKVEHTLGCGAFVRNWGIQPKGGRFT